MDRIPSRRRAVSTLLAIFLAVESVGAVSVAAGTALAESRVAAPPPAAPPAGNDPAVGLDARTWDRPLAQPPMAALIVPDEPPLPRATGPAATASPTPQPTPLPTAKPTPKPAAKAVAPRAPANATPKPKAKPAPVRQPVASYRGRNHVWIPSLGISQSVSFFSCTRSAPPANYVYRWGCAGTNNVYLLGHASGVFAPLHDAYVGGRLRAGMRVIYADGSGKAHTYAVQFWRLVAPNGDVGWAYASLSVPSMTLQTCVGANSQYRLVVRLVQIK